MFSIKDAYATVWKVEDKGNYALGRISTRERDYRDKNKFIYSSWFVRFVGEAKEKSLKLSEKDRIKIINGKINNKKSYLNIIIFDFEVLNNKSDTTEEDEVPF